MASDFTPEARATLNASTGPLPSVPVLRGRRTRHRNAVQTDLDWLKQVVAVSDDNRLAILSAKSRVESRFEELRTTNLQIASHPLLSPDDIDREIEESESAIDVVVSARALLAALCAGTDIETAAALISNSSAPAIAQAQSGAAAIAIQPVALTASNSSAAGALGSITGVSAENVLPAAVTTAASSSTSGLGASGASVCTNSRLYLDTTPEPFDGKVSRYKLWKAQFMNYVQRRTEATGADKLVALCKLLKGAPKDIISELPLSDRSFDVAIKLLDENYDTPELCQRDVLNSLSSVPHVRHQNDITALRDLLNTVQRTILSLESVNVPLKDIALPYEQTIRKALPTSLLLNFEDRLQLDTLSTSSAVSDDAATTATDRLEKLLSFLRRYVALRERIVHPDSSTRTQSVVADSALHGASAQRRPRHPPRNNNVSTAAAAARINPRTQAKSRKNPCLFCKSMEHLPSRCTANLTLQQRREILSQRRRCLKCFQFEHSPSRQCSGPREACGACGSRDHYTVMHDVPSASTPSTTATGVTQTITATTAGVVQTAAATATIRSMVSTASAYVIHGDAKIPVRCFIDNGSMVSFATPKLIKRLTGIRPQAKAELHLQGIAGQHIVVANRFSLRIQSTYESEEQIYLQTHEFDFGVDPPSNCSEKMLQLIRKFGEKHPLADKSLLDRKHEAEPDLLIGVDQMYKILHLNNEIEIGGGLVGKSSRLGWVVNGSFTPSATRGEIIRIKPICCPATLSQDAQDVECLWTLEAIGVTDDKTEELTAEEQNAQQQFREGVVYNGQFYKVPMPKSSSIGQLSNNLEVARRRLVSKRRSLTRDPVAFNHYHEAIMEFVHAGHAVEVRGVDLTVQSVRDTTYYMPHSMVITQRPEGVKRRVVFDCSASAPGEGSLNSHLLNGPNLNPDILKLLINFRLRAVGLCADIAHAYMTIHVIEEDRAYFRFIWQGPSDTQPRCFEMKKVTWGAKPSGFLLAAVLRDHFERFDPSGAYDLGGSFYFDDMLRSFDTESEAIQFIDKIVPMLELADMKLGKWKTNSSSVFDHIQKTRSLPVTNHLLQTGVLKVLGVAWAPTEDAFRFQLSAVMEAIEKMRNITKRNILRIVASIYDPANWLIPYVIRGKLLIQKMWSTDLSWDDPVTDQLKHEFEAWAREAAELSSLRIQRLYGDPNRAVSSYQLHVFGDASEKAYAAVCYLQTIYADGGSSCALVMAKSRLAPRDKVTLPRLELMAALISARLRAFVLARINISIDRVFHYTDSTVAYYWCTSTDPSRFKTFVCNRVSEIHKLTKPDEWFHCDGKMNISDIPTRGVSAREIISNREWWNGPSWLFEAEAHRPVRRLQPGCDNGDPVSQELRLVVTPAVVSTPWLIDLERFGSWEKAVRVMSNVLRFIQRCRRREPPSEVQLLTRAEIIILKITQRNHFASEINATLAGERPIQSSRLSSFQLFMDSNGLLRARTRLTQCPHLTSDEQCPIIIPDRCRLATLLILHHHRVNAHLGVNAVLNALRRRYWILRARQIIKSILRGCVVCRRAHGATADQVQPPLPAERVALTVPFLASMVDHCGPFYTRSREGTCKNYIAIFTCLSVRAVHLELVPDMSTPQTHLAVRRFLATFPACRSIISDNGRSFVRAAADLRRLFNSYRNPEVQRLLAEHRVEWTFSCPRAAWRNGAIERLVSVTKSSLSKTLGRSLISPEELRTILCEISSVINSRPISYTYSDVNEPRAITPADFLRGGPQPLPMCALAPLDALGPNGNVLPPEDGAGLLRRSLTQRTTYFQALANRWRKEYLLLLRSANLDGGGRPREIPDGMICLLKEDSVPRKNWNLVRIVGKHCGRDGVVRTYSVKFSNGYESRRAAQLLIPLEVSDKPAKSQIGHNM